VQQRAVADVVVQVVEAGVGVRGRVSGHGLLTDWLLVNDAMRTHVIPDSYRVHIAPNRRPLPALHRLVTAAIDL
jgi:hypothetical protein